MDQCLSKKLLAMQGKDGRQKVQADEPKVSSLDIEANAKGFIAHARF